MKDELIETGKVLGTHGVKGQLRLQPWADSSEVLADIKCLYIDGTPFEVNSSRIHKSNVIVSFEGVDSVDAAKALKSKVVYAKRGDIKLKEGTYFITDLIGLTAIDSATGESLGTVIDVLTLPANNVYVIKGEREILIPAVPEFIEETNPEEGFIRFRLLEGL